MTDNVETNADSNISLGANAERTLIAIGRRIRKLRKDRGLTLQQLAGAAGISSSMLSLVERGLASPSIGSLIVVSEALGRPMSDLMDIDNHSDDIVVRSESAQAVVTNGNVLRQVMKEDLSNGVSIAINQYQPGAASNETALAHDGFEYGLVLEGAMTVEVDGISHELKEGDLIAYSSRRPHRIWNSGTVTARTVWFNTDRR